MRNHIVLTFGSGNTGDTGTSQRGFNLIEVLIALVVLSLGLLGLAALQNMGLRLGHQSYERTQATNLIYEMIDRMRANSAGVQLGAYQRAFADPIPALVQDCTLGGVICTPTNMATYDMNQWLSTLTGTNNGSNVVQSPARPMLAGGQAAIVALGGSIYDISVQWQEQNVVQLQTVRVQLP